MAIGDIRRNLEDRAKRPAREKAVPVDDLPERMAAAIERFRGDLDDRLVDVLKNVLGELVKKDTVVELDADAIGSAIGRQLARLPQPRITVSRTEPDPVAYKVTVERGSRDGRALEYLIQPVQPEVR